jgi:cystathionine beta-lyase/cystathionine gamma-synthase
MNSEHKFETRAIHAGQQPDPTSGAVMAPIVLSSTFKQDAVGRPRGYEYSRTGNPTRATLERCLASLEGADYALAFASGMAATDAVIHLLSPGDHVLAMNDLYGGTYRLFEHVYAQFGISFSYAPGDPPGVFLSHLQDNTRLIWLETPSNPLLNLCNIQAIAQVARDHPNRPWVCVDNTFATPYLQQPLRLGAHLVLHSTTKYLGGHSDVVGGAVVTGEAELAERLAFLQNAIGAVPSPFDCFLVLRGIKTLPVRMERHAQNARELAAFLQEHPAVKRVFYPTLESHPGHEIARRQMRNGGGMISFIVQGGPQAAKRVAEGTRIFTLAESLGGVESLIEVPAAMTHLSTRDSPLQVDPALLRLSVGLENVDDLKADLEQALARLL